MTSRKDGALLVGVGAAACAVCCAGPILGFLTAIGLGTALGFAAFGATALVIGAAIAVFTIVRHRRRAIECAPSPAIPVELSLDLGQARHQMFGSAE